MAQIRPGQPKGTVSEDKTKNLNQEDIGKLYNRDEGSGVEYDLGRKDDIRKLSDGAEGSDVEYDLGLAYGTSSNLSFLRLLLKTEHFKWKSEKDGIFQLLELEKADEILKEKKLSLKEALEKAIESGDLVKEKDGDNTYKLGPEGQEFIQKISKK